MAKIAPMVATRAVCAFFRGLSLHMCAHYYRIPYPVMCDLIRSYRMFEDREKARKK